MQKILFICFSFGFKFFSKSVKNWIVRIIASRYLSLKTNLPEHVCMQDQKDMTYEVKIRRSINNFELN